ncbi:hypothetical protein H072_8811 [Dactylellina haptotyla CBS 200.50]|uniref:Uncharacterized protein n=1 Tax=Dactylellina haptotyla (strain CBS 200.50) TaxID=1284197 RepID=S8A8N9_DACHA|nr:hypothetical protein H072_8811 [Dactylellina haptotyla CBS 200.50]
MASEAKSHEEYTVGWICALPKELAVAISMLDEEHPALSKSANDSNCYTLGSIGPHNVSIACLPKNWVGTSQAAKVTAQMATTFPSIKVVLMVGIGAGIPSQVSLGDVVISTEWAQWDFGKTKDGKFEYVDKRCYPPDALLSVLSKFEAEHIRQRAKVLDYLEKLKHQFPPLASPDKGLEDLRVHYGLVASGNQVVKDADLRDSIFIIRGICDYADSNKNDDWHEYAAIVSAAFAKQLLEYLPSSSLENERAGKDVYNKAFSERMLSRHGLELEKEGKILTWLTDIDYNSRQNDYFNSRQPKTGEWLLNSAEYQEWLHMSHKILFCRGMPGAGKTIMTSVVVDHLETHYLNDSKIGIAYIYFNFKRTEEQGIDKTMLSLLKQLSQRQDKVPNCLRDRNVNVFATSRPVFDIETDFKNVNSLILEIKASDEDVRRYLDGKIDVSGMAVLKRNRKAIVTKISEFVSGMGQAAYDRAYEDAMNRITDTNDEDSRDLAFRAITWITCATRLLTTAELSHALAIEVDRAEDGENELDNDQILEVDDMVSLCTGLVKVNEETDVVRLVHYTTQEYFDRTWQQWFPDAHDEIAVASCEGLLSPVIILLEKGEEIEAKDSNGRTALSWAAGAGDEAVVKLLVDKDADIEVKGISSKTALFWAAQNGYEKVVRNLVDMGADMEAKSDWDQTALLWAAQQGEKEVVEVLIDKGADIEAKDITGQTPLFCAAEVGEEAVVRLLIDKGADMEAKNNRGQTVLSCAVSSQQEAIVKLLIDKGADIEANDESGRTALSWAAEEGKEAIIKLLIARGANIEAKDNSGRTALSWAVQARKELAAKLLIDQGADVEAKDNIDRTALAWASERRRG